MRGASRAIGAMLVTLTLGACASAAPGTSSHGGASPSAASPASSATGDQCLARAKGLSAEEQAGQMFMLGVNTSGLDVATRTAIEEGKIGSVVLLGNSTAGASRISALTSSVARMGSEDLPILVAVDQEGGTVQRLKGDGFSQIPNAVQQGSFGDGQLRTAAKKWGEELKAAGVHFDLAPVADVVPAAKQNSNAPIGKLKRNFGNDVATVSSSVTGFTQGMGDAGVLTSLKHFPGLGEVTVNTDFGVAVDDDITADDEYLQPFKAGIDAGADSVMVSSAIFKKIDPDQEGVFSKAIVTDLLRGKLGFKGVAISDDLGVAEAVGDVKPADRAVRFFAAGGDLLINADPAMMDEMLKATLDWAAKDPANAERLAESAGRVLRLKESAGLLTCG